MIKKSICFVLLIVIQIVNCNDVSALININIKEFLAKREQAWPNWNLPDSKFSNTKKDLIYPIWFEGDWLVKSTDLNNDPQEELTYKVNFYKNQFGDVVANRSQNSESIGKSMFGNRILKVNNDPNSFNNQITYLTNNEYIESRLTIRKQTYDKGIFWADEFAIQTYHKNGVSRINQVEVMSKFFECSDEFISSGKNDICGYQYVATYGSRVGDVVAKNIKSNKYKLIFKAIEG